ncbi:MAG: TetR/AcrR family transcriptional regulator [Cyclobacteriaceae bacterium]|nr:TetR/AcrR family transcriptional regulator [Cyclobacteriaceae bacterium]
MEKAKKTSRKTKAAGKPARDKIISAYRETLLTEGKVPSSVYTFSQSIGIKEDDFYQYFGSFEAVDKEIWNGYFQSVASRLTSDKNYSSFSTREKILAFYFTLAEVLKEDRSFALLTLKEWRNPAFTPDAMKAFKNSFEEWLTPVLNEGKQNGEIAKRPLFDSRYDALFWMHLIFILQFWTRDNSVGFEKTDAAIEKSVNLAFDLIGNGILDNALDFGKFLYQNSKN